MRRVITAQDIPPSGELRVPVGALFTASALELLQLRGVRLVELPPEQLAALTAPERIVAMGADHSGFRLKKALKPVLAGIRAAPCYDRASVRNSRESNDSNILTLGARLLTASQAEEVLRTWIATRFAGGRHLARIQKITQIEQDYCK